jgi:hypothetical protein
MATKKEIKEHLHIALKEIGLIKPWFDYEVNEWIFSHCMYPVEYGGDSPEEVIENYPLYLEEFIKHRLNDNLNPLTEKKTLGHGGKRSGAGRPMGTIKEPTKRIVLPLDIATWIGQPGALDKIRNIMHKR